MAQMAMDTKTKGAITLQGSAAMIREFFHYGIHNILYQRGIYNADSFVREKRFGMTLLVSTDIRVQRFLEPFLARLQQHLAEKSLKKMVLAIFDVKTKEVLERWVFDIQEDQVNDENSNVLDEKRVKNGMANVLRQITASVTFLPQMETECSFDVLIGLKRGTKREEEADFQSTTDVKIANAECVQLRSFATGHHDVKASVEYKADA